MSSVSGFSSSAYPGLDATLLEFSQKMGGHLRLLNIACAAKAKRRLMTLTKPSREAPLPFILLGGSEKGFGIFVDSVDSCSKATEAGLKRGDQVRGKTQLGYMGISEPLCFSQ